MIYFPKREELFFEARTSEKCQAVCDKYIEIFIDLFSIKSVNFEVIKFDGGYGENENGEKPASIFELLVSSKVQFKCFVWRFCPLGFETLAAIVRGDRHVEMETSELTKEDIASLIAIWVDYGVVRNFKVSGMTGILLCDLIRYTHWPLCTKNNNKSVDVVRKNNVAARIDLNREECKITPLCKHR